MTLQGSDRTFVNLLQLAQEEPLLVNVSPSTLQMSRRSASGFVHWLRYYRWEPQSFEEMEEALASYKADPGFMHTMPAVESLDMGRCLQHPETLSELSLIHI